MIYYCRHHKDKVNQSKAVNYCLDSKCWALKMFSSNGQLKRFTNKMRACAKESRALITKEQWAKIKKGTVLVTPLGKERIVVADRATPDGCVTLEKISNGGFADNVTAYLYHDIYKKYRVKKY